MSADDPFVLTMERLTRHRRVTVMGLGSFGGGVGAARFWCELGADVTVTDLRSERDLAASLAVLTGLTFTRRFGKHCDEDFLSADIVVVNPAVKPENSYLRLARNAGAEIITEAGLVFRLCKGPLIAVSGSNGKSTTTALIGAMLRAHNPRTLVGGNIGGSLLPELKAHLPSAPIVLELSSFQLHYLKSQKIAPAIAVMTNLTPNHLDWHQTTLRYYEDKRILVQQQTAADVAVLNVDDPTLRAWVEDCPGRVVHVARIDPETPDACFLNADAKIIFRWDGHDVTLAEMAALQLPGAHNQGNALLAAAAAFVHSRNAEAVAQGLGDFSGLPHRLEEVATVGEVRFIDDSIATTPESCIAALASYSCPRVLIAGGYDKGASFDEMARAMVDEAAAVILIGDCAAKISTAIAAADPVGELRVTQAGEDFPQAVQIAHEACPAGGVVLLSPGCASYGMFANFVERGNTFREIANTI